MAASRSDLENALIRDGYLAPDFDKPTKRSDAEREADEIASIRLLGGYGVDEMYNIDRPKHNSAEERELRAALARTIRDQMTGLSAELLAMAIDPHTPSPLPQMRPTRCIKFETPGQPSTLFIEKQVIDYIRRLRFNSDQPHNQKYYIMSAVVEFQRRGIEMKKSRVHAIWSEYEKMLEAAASTK
jgi:hypothetical protein